MEEKSSIKVLIVEDDPAAAALYQKILKIPGKVSFDVTWADCLAKALECQGRESFRVILSDLSLPDSSGLNTFVKIKELARDVPIIILTGAEDEAMAVKAIGEGAQDYISKARIDHHGFLNAISYAIERSRIQKELKDAKNDLEEKVKERTVELQAERDKLQRILVQSVDSLGFALEKRDAYTAGHQRRVAQLAVAVARLLGLSEHETIGLSLASSVHDIGKMGVPLELLVKPGRLSEDELKTIWRHPEVGYVILKDIEFSWPIAEMVYQHHERINGSGYPRGLSGDWILLEAKILCVADVVEAMASDRPYRPAIGIEGALEELSLNKGVLYEPRVVDACMKLFKENSFQFV